MEKKATGKFVVQVDRCENAIWQGSILWTEKNITRQFRSALELFRLIDSAVTAGEKES